jgi:hypothetical protein
MSHGGGPATAPSRDRLVELDLVLVQIARRAGVQTRPMVLDRLAYRLRVRGEQERVEMAPRSERELRPHRGPTRRGRRDLAGAAAAGGEQRRPRKHLPAVELHRRH